MPELMAAICVLLVTSALASGTEAALFSIPYGQVLSYTSQGTRGASALKTIKDNMARPIMTIVIVNNVANIVGSILVGALATTVLGSQWIGLFSGVLTLLVIIFGEIVPKTVGERFSHSIALTMSVPVLTAARILLPLIWTIELVTRPFAAKGQGFATSEEEITALTRLGQQTGAIEPDESELIQRVFRLNDVTAWDIMTPLSQIDAIDGRRTLGDVREELMTLTHTRLPVHEGSLDKLLGVVHLRAMLQALSNGQEMLPVRALAKEPSFIPDTATGDDLLRHFQRTKQHLAIVVDAFGTVLGLLTLEDVLEVLVGDIMDETDFEPDTIKRLSKSEILVDASTEMEDIVRILKLEGVPSDGRIGEKLIDHLGHIPAVGDVIPIEELAITITVTEATPRAIQRLRVVKA